MACSGGVMARADASDGEDAWTWIGRSLLARVGLGRQVTPLPVRHMGRLGRDTRVPRRGVSVASLVDGRRNKLATVGATGCTLGRDRGATEPATVGARPDKDARDTERDSVTAPASISPRRRYR